MSSIAYGSGAYRKDDGNFPELKLVNLYLEPATTSENQVALLSRPGLGLFQTNGAGPIGGMFAKPGTFGGDIFSISGANVYRAAASLGAITGTGTASFAGGFGELIVTLGQTLYSYNGTNLVGAGFTGNSSNNVTACCFINSLFVALEAGSARFFWSAPLNGRSWNILNFATAEREPDNLLDCARLGNNLWLFGENTVEAWAHTGDADLPFSNIESILFDKGIMATGCVVAADNSLFFVSNERVVYRLGDTPVRVSNNGIEERIAASAGARLFSYWRDGHEFVVVRLDSETLAFDCSTNQWAELQTGGSNWIAGCAAMQGKTAYFGNASNGEIMTFSGWDDRGTALERSFTAALPLDSPLAIDRMRLWANSGATTVLSGQGSNPIIEMRSSDDAGRTWSDWDSDTLGSEGDYRAVPEWRALGMFDFPGALFEFRVTDPVPFRLSAVKANDSGGGRSR